MSQGNIVSAALRRGAPMPQALRPYINEQIFDKLKADCRGARTRADFDAVVARYNAEQNWRGSLQGFIAEYNANELMWKQIFTLGM